MPTATGKRGITAVAISASKDYLNQTPDCYFKLYFSLKIIHPTPPCCLTPLKLKAEQSNPLDVQGFEAYFESIVCSNRVLSSGGKGGVVGWVWRFPLLTKNLPKSSN